MTDTPLVTITRSALVDLIDRSIAHSHMPDDEADKVRAEARQREHFLWGDSERATYSCPLHAAGIWQKWENAAANETPDWFGRFWSHYDSAVNDYAYDQGIDLTR